MTNEDLDAYIKWFDWSSDISPKTICLLSCNSQQQHIICDIFKNSFIFPHTIRSWNLNNRIQEQYDLIVACNVFMYSNDPSLWFSNVLYSCKTFWIQDIINRKRGSVSELGDDNDRMRYSYRQFKSNFQNSVDIESFGSVTKFHSYYSSNSLHFLAEMKNK